MVGSIKNKGENRVKGCASSAEQGLQLPTEASGWRCSDSTGTWPVQHDLTCIAATVEQVEAAELAAEQVNETLNRVTGWAVEGAGSVLPTHRFLPHITLCPTVPTLHPGLNQNNISSIYFAVLLSAATVKGLPGCLGGCVACSPTLICVNRVVALCFAWIIQPRIHFTASV
jgi:hypothetical protein